MSTSKIEWTEATWNPIVGCSILTPGCTNCYAMKMAARIEKINAEARSRGVSHSSHYDGTTKSVNGKIVWTGKLALAPEAILLQPLKRKKPTTYFVNSMGDLFHEDCPDEWIDRVFAVMALSPQHIFQVLTKRAARMLEYFDPRGPGAAKRISRLAPNALIKLPLPNVWLGVSTERQQEADQRIPLLLQTPAAIRFISAEPLLGPIDLHPSWLPCPKCRSRGYYLERFSDNFMSPCSDCDRLARESGLLLLPGQHVKPGARLDWVIVGGESGPGARPMHPDWARSLQQQCVGAVAKFFFKQWGSFVPIIDRDKDDPDWRRDYTRASHDPGRFKILNLAGGCGFHGERVHLMQLFSKAHAGRLLDGVEYNEMPEAR